MEPNPHDAPETEKPIPAQLARKNPLLSRLLFDAVPTCCDVSIMTGVGALYGGNWIAAAVFFAFAAVGLYLTWGWTRCRPWRGSLS